MYELQFNSKGKENNTDKLLTYTRFISYKIFFFLVQSLIWF